MSAENVRVVKQAYEAFGRGDLPAVLEHFDEDVEWHAAEGLPWGGVHNGRDAVARNVFGGADCRIRRFPLSHDRFIDSGEFVVALGRYSAKGKESGKPLDAAFAHVWELEDGRLKRYFHYTDTVRFQEALA